MGSDYWTRYARRGYSRRRLLAGSGTAVAGAGALALAGCGDDDDGPAPTTGSGGSSTAPAGASPTQQAKPQPSNAKVNVGVAVAPNDPMDPHDTIGGPSANFQGNVFQALYEYGKNGQSAPSLAQSVEITPDGLTITFKLRPNVKFQNGAPMTGEDIAWNWTRFVDPQLKTSKTTFRNVSGVTAVDASTVAFKMKQPDNGFVVDAFGGRYFKIIPRAYFEQVGRDKFGVEPIGTGPYKATRYEKGIGATFERFQDYWGGPAPFAGATFKALPEATTRVNALEVGDVDIVNAIPPQLVTRTKGINGVSVIPYPTNIDLFYKLAIDIPTGTPSDLTKLMKQDVRVRQALNYAIDKAGIAKAVYGPEFAEAYAVTNKSQPFHINKQYEYDVKKAKDLLSAAGAPSGLVAEVWHPAEGRQPGTDALGAVVVQNLKDAGLSPKFTAEEYTVYLNRIRKAVPPENTGLILSWAATANFATPFPGADLNYTANSDFNWWVDPKFDGLLDKARTIVNEQERNATLKEAMQYLFDQAPGAWLVLLKEPQAFRTKVIKSMDVRENSVGTLFIADLFPAA